MIHTPIGYILMIDPPSTPWTPYLSTLTAVTPTSAPSTQPTHIEDITLTSDPRAIIYKIRVIKYIVTNV